jgi:hypothetical protein
MVIGFPAKKYPEYRFRFAGFRKDRGMALKNFGEKGWGLFDYQTTDVLMGEPIPEKKEAKANRPVPLTNDAFTVVLASVIDDPGLLATPLVYMPAAEAAPSTAGRAKHTTGAPVPTPASAAGKVPAPATAGAKVPGPVTTGTKVPARDSTQPVAMADKKEPIVAAVAKDQDSVSVKPVAITDGKEPVVTAADATKDTDTASTKPEAVKDAVPVSVAAAVEKPMQADSGKKSQASATGIVRLRESSSAEGLTISYLDPQGGGVGDTVSILIPVGKDSAPVLMVAADPDAQPTKPQADLAVADTAAAPIKAAPVVTSPVPSADAGKAPVKEAMTLTDSAVATKDTLSRAAPARPNRSNCARMATEKDLGAVRKKMVGIRDEDEMVAVALKDFKARCYTTEQVKAICFVFTREEGRYKLLDAAYPYVYDPANFGQLESLLSDKYFIYRFNALIQK